MSSVSEWTGFGLAWVFFFLTHTLPIRPPLRTLLVRRLGPRVFTTLYSGLSLLVLVWLVIEAGRAPFVMLWPWYPWQNAVAILVMFPVCVLLCLAIGRPNPFSFGGTRNASFNPAQPGIVRLTRHPLLVALALWAGAHALANGDLAHVLLFGGFALFALAGRRVIDRRRQREMGEQWYILNQELSEASWLQLWSGHEPWRILAAIGLYLSLLFLHPLLIGVAPI